MTNKKLTTPEMILEKIGAKDFRSINKEQIIAFATNLPNMDSDVAKECIKQFPNFKDYATQIVNHYYDLCNTTIENANKHSIEKISLIIDDLRYELKKDNISEAYQEFIIENIIKASQILEDAEHSKNKLSQTIIQTAGVVGVFALAVGATILGAKIDNKS